MFESAKVIAPHPGPQTEFLASPAWLAIISGESGSGRTTAVLLDWLRHIESPDACGLLYRDDVKTITVAGGLWDQATALYSATGARVHGAQFMDITWPSGAALQVRHADSIGAGLRGGSWSWIGIDEAQECGMNTIIRLMTRSRGRGGARPTVRMSATPDPEHPIAEWVAPFLADDGTVDADLAGSIREAPRGCAHYTVFGCKLDDNPTLLAADPGFRARLAMLGSECAGMLSGSWRSPVVA